MYLLTQNFPFMLRQTWDAASFLCTAQIKLNFSRSHIKVWSYVTFSL